MKTAVKLLMIAFACALAGCSQEKREDLSVLENATVKIALSVSNLTQVKAPVIDDRQISDVNILVFDSSGQLVANTYTAGEYKLSFPVWKNERYYVYAIANAGREMIFKDTAEINNYGLRINTVDEMAGSGGAVLFTGRTSLVKLYDGAVVDITLKRVIAKIVLKGNKEELDYGVYVNIDSIKIKNVPSYIRLFGQSKAESGGDVFDKGYSLKGEDVAGFFGDGVTFYMFENMQGELLPSNTSQKEKYWQKNDFFYQTCTYVEIAATYKSGKKKGNIIYRFYLGRNEVTDFSVERNTCQMITVYFSGDASASENYWRVATSGLEDISTIELAVPRLSLELGGRAFHLQYRKLISTAQLPTFVSMDPSVVEVTSVYEIEARLSPKGIGETFVVATLEDGYAICRVTVTAETADL